MSKNDFPGYKKCMEMMNKRDSWICEDGFHFLWHQASSYTKELIDDYRSKKYKNIPRFWYLELIAENPSDDYADFWFEELWKFPEFGHRRFILSSLAKMGRNVRKRMWQIRQKLELYTEETDAFRQLIDDRFGWDT